MAQDRVTIQEAARRLGVKEDAIRKRIQRGTLWHEKTEAGRVFVWVDATQDTTEDVAQDTYRDAVRHREPDALISAKDETIATLRDQLEAERQAHAEARRLLMAALERIPPQIEAPSEARESPEMVEEEPERVEPHPHRAGAQEGAQRTWWRRMFGG